MSSTVGLTVMMVSDARKLISLTMHGGQLHSAVTSLWHPVEMSGRTSREPAFAKVTYVSFLKSLAWSFGSMVEFG